MDCNQRLLASLSEFKYIKQLDQA